MKKIKHLFGSVFEIIVIFAIFALLIYPVRAELSPVKVDAVLSGKVVQPGETVEFTLSLETLYNTSKDLTVNLFFDNKPENWVAGFYSDNNQINVLTFSPDSINTKQVVLRLKVPYNISNASYLIRIRLQAYSEDINNYEPVYRNFIATVDKNALPNLDIYSTITGKKTHPGLPVKFSLTVENKYDTRSTIKLTVLSKPEEWGVDMISSDSTRITKMSIPSQSKDSFEVNVQPSLNATEGEYQIVIGASMESGSHIITLPLSVTINPVMDSSMALSAYLDMRSAIPGLEVRPEKSAEFTLSLKNRYDQQILLFLKTLSKPEDWIVEFLSESDSAVRLTSLDLSPNTEQKFIVKIKPSANTTDGIYPVIINAVSLDQRSVTQKLEVTVNRGLENNQVLSVYPSYSEMTLNPGSSNEISVTVRNGGNEALTKVKLEVNDVSGITTTIRSFQEIDKLEASESKTIPVEIKARADSDAGIKEIFMRAKSGDILSDEKSIKINVEKSGSSGIAGILLVVLSVAGLLLIIRKFGRR